MPQLCLRLVVLAQHRMDCVYPCSDYNLDWVHSVGVFAVVEQLLESFFDLALVQLCPVVIVQHHCYGCLLVVVQVVDFVSEQVVCKQIVLQKVRRRIAFVLRIMFFHLLFVAFVVLVVAVAVVFVEVVVVSVLVLVD